MSLVDYAVDRDVLVDYDSLARGAPEPSPNAMLKGERDLSQLLSGNGWTPEGGSWRDGETRVYYPVRDAAIMQLRRNVGRLGLQVDDAEIVRSVDDALSRFGIYG